MHLVGLYIYIIYILHCTNKDDGHEVGRLEGKIPLGTLRRRWENNIKMNLQFVGSGGLNWIHLAWDTDR